MGQQCGFSKAMLLRQLRIMMERIRNAIPEIDLSHPKRAVVAEFILERGSGLSAIL
jgi:hypothetical protein